MVWSSNKLRPRVHRKYSSRSISSIIPQNNYRKNGRGQSASSSRRERNSFLSLSFLPLSLGPLSVRSFLYDTSRSISSSSSYIISQLRNFSPRIHACITLLLAASFFYYAYQNAAFQRMRLRTKTITLSLLHWKHYSGKLIFRSSCSFYDTLINTLAHYIYLRD